MNSRVPSLLALLLLFALPTLCQHRTSSAKRATVLRPDGGTFINGVYKNGHFGFSFAMGSDWLSNDDLMQADRVQSQKIPGRFCLLIADRHTGGPMRERMLLIADDTNSFKPSIKLEDWVKRMTRALVKRSGAELTRDAYAVEYAGQHFYRADFKENYSGGALYKTYLANEYEGFLFSWTFVADSEERLHQIVNSLNSLTFARDSK
jgi:hypothetical protein